MSTGCKFSHNGFLDVSHSNGGLRISGWIGQLSCLTNISTSLSVAAFLRRAGGSMLESTGSHGRGVERRVPEMRCMVEFNYDDMLSRFHLIPERCGQTDGRTDRRTDLLYQYRASVCWRAIIIKKIFNSSEASHGFSVAVLPDMLMTSRGSVVKETEGFSWLQRRYASPEVYDMQYLDVDVWQLGNTSNKQYEHVRSVTRGFAGWFLIQLAVLQSKIIVSPSPGQW